MPGFKDFVNLATLLETDMDDLLMKQTVMKLASVAARTAALTGFFREGLMTYLDDLNTLGVNTAAADTWSTIGPVHGQLPAWTPVITQSGTVTWNNVHNSYTRVGRAVFFNFNCNVTGTGTGANNVTVSLPVAAIVNDADEILGVGHIFDSSAALLYAGRLVFSSATTVKFECGDSVVAAASYGYLGVNFFTAALAVNDVVSGSGWYEAAADA